MERGFRLVMSRRMAERIGRRALMLCGVLALAACTGLPEGVTPGAVGDPYADLPGGGARYTGALGEVGVLAGLATPEGFAASAGAVITFAEGQVALSDPARRIVAAQAHWLVQNRNFTATIEGHADEPGTREYNLALAARRAATVQEYLIAGGVEPGRLRTVSYGKERPAGPCDAGDCAARNRRVVTVVAPGSGA